VIASICLRPINTKDGDRSRDYLFKGEIAVKKLIGERKSGKVFWRMKQLKQNRVCPTKKQTQEVAIKKALASRHLFLFSLSNLAPISLPPSTSRSPRRARSWSKLLESSPGVVCPDGSTSTLLHWGLHWKGLKQVSTIVPNNCQECV